MNGLTHKNTAKIECKWAIGLLFPEGLKFVTRLEKYLSKYFYWENGKEPQYFSSKSIADDYAVGMLLNGYPAVVMEIPNGFILKNPDKENVEKGEVNNESALCEKRKMAGYGDKRCARLLLRLSYR